MKKALIPILILLSIVMYSVVLRYKENSITEVSGFVFSNNALSKNLLSTNEDKFKNIKLKEVKKGEQLYTRNGKMFFGEKNKQKFVHNYPLVSKKLNRLYLYDSNTVINDDFEKLSSFPTALVSETNVYDTISYEKVDNDEYIFVLLDDNILLNLVELNITTESYNYNIPKYSFINFSTDIVKYYSFRSNKLDYNKIMDVELNSKIKIKDNEYVYKQFLSNMGLFDFPDVIKREEPLEEFVKLEKKPERPAEPESIIIDDEEITYIKPEVHASKIKGNIYSANFELTINDPTNRIISAPSFELIHKNKIYLRKSFYSSGDSEFIGLIPDSNYEVVGSYVYLNENDTKIRVTFMESSFKTNNRDKLEAFDYSYKVKEIFPTKIKLDDFVSLNKIDAEVLKGIKEIKLVLNDHEYNFSSNSVNDIARGKEIVFSTPNNLSSNTVFNGKLEVYDLENKKINVVNKSLKFKTSKKDPSVNVKVTSTDITKLTLQVEVDNPDNINLQNFKYIVYDNEMKLVTTALTPQNNVINIDNLNANSYYFIKFYADYDLEDGKGSQKEILLKDTRVSTLPISTLGLIRINYEFTELKQREALYNLKINTNSTDERLLSLLDRIVITVRDKYNDAFVDEIIIDSNDITTLKAGDSIPIVIENLQSYKEYKVETITIVKQGDIEFTLNALTNLKEFTSLKEDAKVYITNQFTTSNLIDFDVMIDDKDGAIESNRVLLEVRNSVGALVLMQEFKINSDYERITLDKLVKDEVYTFKFIAEEYNLGLTNLTYEPDKVLLLKDVTTEEGLVGEIKIDSVLSQIISNNIFDISNLNKWRFDGNSNITEYINNIKENKMILSAKNGYANYSYTLADYAGDEINLKFKARYAPDSNNENVYLSYGARATKQIKMSNMSYEWQEFDYSLELPVNGYFGFHIEEIAAMNNITTLEIKDLFVTSLSTAPAPTIIDSYHSSGKIFTKTNVLAGSDYMPQPNNTVSQGNWGNGKAVITDLEKTSTKKADKTLDNVRYIKSCLNGSSSNTINHWVEIMAMKGNNNVALNKTVLGTKSVTRSTYIVDGDIDTARYAQISSGLNCVIVDLEQHYDLDEVKLWLYYGDGRTYYDNTLSVGSTLTSGTEPLENIIHSYPGKTGYASSEFGRSYYTLYDNSELFRYTGDYQVFTAPESSNYKVELWGASGGGSVNAGRGGYTQGEIYLQRGEKLYVYVGEEGQASSYGNNDLKTVGPGGRSTFNGGGPGGNAGGGRHPYANYRGGHSGGGATDVRYFSSNPSASDLNWNSTLGLKSRIMVAGGGGGSGGNNTFDHIRGHAGGLVSEQGGLQSSFNFNSYPNVRGLGAGQFYGNSLGIGGRGSDSGITTACNGHSGGGGGWFGGYGGNHTNGSCYIVGGGGGSSFVSGHRGSMASGEIKLTGDIKYEEEENYLGTFFLSVYDLKLELENKEFYVQLLNNGVEENMFQYNLSENHTLENYLVEYELGKNASYEINLLVKIRDRYYTIKTLSFNTTEEIRTISSEQELIDIHVNGIYLVNNELNFRGKSMSTPITFNGEIDFQGNKLNLSTRGSSNYLIYRLGPSGKIKNLDLYFSVDSDDTSHSGLLYYNRGIVSNFMITIDEVDSNGVSDFAMLSYINYGVMENFVINNKAVLPMKHMAAIITRYHDGYLRNGYLYGEKIDGTVGNGLTSNKRVGALVGYSRRAAAIENIFSLIEVDIKHEDLRDSDYDNTAGNIIGYSERVNISNVFSVGLGENRDLEGDPNIGAISSMKHKNLFYINDKIHVDSTSLKVSKTALRNETFYEKTINNSDEFNVTDFVKYGYFPQVNLDDSLPKQEYVELPDVKDSDLVDVLMIEDIEQDMDSAIVTVLVHNPAAENITSILIKDLTTNIISQSHENGTTTIKLSLTNPLRYTSIYFVKSITSVGVFGISTTKTYADNEKVLEMDLYKPIYDINDYLDIKKSLNENYMLMNDLDFTNVPNPNLGTFYGKLNGNGFTIRNIRSTSSNGVLMYQLIGGALININLEDVVKTNSTSYTGIIGRARDGAHVSDVHVKNIEIAASQYVGGIVGDLYSSGVVENSSVTNFRVTKLTDLSSIRLGGIVGRNYVSIIRNSFAQDIDLNVDDPYIAYGVGGIVGDLNTGDVSNVYAIGKIKTNFPEVGGLVGRNDGSVYNGYSNVIIESSHIHVGGVVGIDNNNSVSKTFSIGDIYTSIDTPYINRISGNKVSPGNYAWVDQKINGYYTTKTFGETLLTREELTNKDYLKDVMQITEAFDIDNLVEDTLPKLLDTTETYLLPNQVDNYFPESLFSVDNVIYDKELERATVLLTINNSSNYDIENIEIEGLKVDEVVKNYTIDGQTTLELKVSPIKYYDSYKMSKLYYIKDGKQESYPIDLKIELQFFKNIGSFEDWQKISTTEYENYRLTGDIDFDNKVNINTGVVINSLDGNGHKLKNLVMESKSARTYFIDSIRSKVSNIKFENIDISTTGSGTGAALIGYLFADIDGIDIQDVKIIAPRINYAAAIGNSRANDIRNVRIDNMEVEGLTYVATFIGTTPAYDLKDVVLTNSTVRGNGSYVGGFIAYKPYLAGPTHFNFTGDNIDVSTPSGTYSGIVYGYGSTVNTTLTNSKVSGYSYVGGISGHQAVYTVYNQVLDNVEVEGSGPRIGGMYGHHYVVRDSIIKNSKVTGTTIDASYVGGLAASGNYSMYDNTVQNVTVETLGERVGGVLGSYTSGSLYRFSVENAKVRGRNYVGGILGYKGGSGTGNIYRNRVNATVTATNNGAGGVVGYHENLANKSNSGRLVLYENIVMNSNISSNYNAGGILGSYEIEPLFANFYKLIIAANISNQNEVTPGLVFGKSNLYLSLLSDIKIYDKTKLNDEVVIDLNEDLLVNSDDLSNESTYSDLKFTSSVFDYEPLRDGDYPIIRYAPQQKPIPIPVSEIQLFGRSFMSFGNLKPLPTFNIYSNGVNKINLDFSEVDPNVTVTINNKEFNVTNKTLSLYYNYNESLSIKVSDGYNTESYNINKAKLIKDFNTIGNDYYYIKDHKLFKNNKQLKGEYIHLFGNTALTRDFNIYDLNTNSIVSESVNNFIISEVTPLQTYNYNNNFIETFSNYSTINSFTEINQQIIIKSNQLELINSNFPNKKDSIIIDSYNKKDYLIILNNNGSIYSLKSPIKYPNNFVNKKIVDMNTNLYNSTNILMVKYQDGSFYAFDYRSGVELFKSHFSKPNPINYFLSNVNKNQKVINETYLESYNTGKEVISKLSKEKPKQVLGKENINEMNLVSSYDYLTGVHEVYEINSLLNNVNKDSYYPLSINDNLKPNLMLTDKFIETNNQTKLKNFKPIIIFVVIFSFISLLIFVLNHTLQRRQRKS